MVSVAQLAEHQIVALRAVGSSPTTHPTKGDNERKPCILLFGTQIILKTAFNIEIPFSKCLWGFCLMYIGLKMILN